ncbi:uracil-DNA glycosylase [Clostridium sp. HMP27]|uniref:uracil-DNA glycosylase n=1 Tax=Clostridium sp. HMP27 TaxID=1487921 RepID=UPI00052BD337|nr:uracil-DNA glycosylase [Clostridium sp. HMP27]KGK81099.1 uracil-DNA glycosylase [Clostridium sp. HMP27]
MNINDELKKIELEIKHITETYKGDLTGGYIVGDGPVPCKILFIGEAPGKTEIEQGKPFVGMAGRTFEKYLSSIGLCRKDIRITNTCFFRPIKSKETLNNRKSISNRPPKTSEINLFKHIAQREIELVNPKIIITLGNVPLKQWTSCTNIGECHGKLIFNNNINTYIFPMYHPSSLIYNRSEDFLKSYEEDWLKLRESLASI